jgi:hypothetical protein
MKGGYDFYDTCVILLVVNGSTIAIPAARCTSPPPFVTDDEHGINTRHPPRGGTNTGSDLEWWYWVPCEDDRWLFFGTNSMNLRGCRQAYILSGEQVSELLRRGDFFASFKDVSELKDVVENSTLACDYLLEFLDGC